MSKAQKLYDEAIGYKKLGKYKKACEVFSKVEKIDSSIEYFYHNWGESLVQLSNLKEAIRILEISIDNKKYATSYAYLSFAYKALGENAKSTEKAKEAISLYEKENNLSKADDYACWGAVLSRIGKKSEAKKKWEESLSLFEKEIKSDKDNAENYNFWGIALTKLQKSDEAIEKYQKAIKINPNYAPPYNNWGNSLSNKKEYDEAIEKYQKAIKINPNNAHPYNNWGNSLSNKKEYDEAIEKYQKAIKINPNNASSYNGWGNTFYKQNKYDEAIKKYEIAIELDSSNAAYLYNLGHVLHQQKKYDQAIEQYKAAIKCDPNDISFYNDWAYILYEQKKYDEAKEKFEQALEIDKSNYNAQYFLNEIEAKKELQNKTEPTQRYNNRFSDNPSIKVQKQKNEKIEGDVQSIKEQKQKNEELKKIEEISFFLKRLLNDSYGRKIEKATTIRHSSKKIIFGIIATIVFYLLLYVATECINRYYFDALLSSEEDLLIIGKLYYRCYQLLLVFLSLVPLYFIIKIFLNFLNSHAIDNGVSNTGYIFAERRWITLIFLFAFIFAVLSFIYLSIITDETRAIDLGFGEIFPISAIYLTFLYFLFFNYNKTKNIRISIESRIAYIEHFEVRFYDLREKLKNFKKEEDISPDIELEKDYIQKMQVRILDMVYSPIIKDSHYKADNKPNFTYQLSENKKG